MTPSDSRGLFVRLAMTPSDARQALGVIHGGVIHGARLLLDMVDRTLFLGGPTVANSELCAEWNLGHALALTLGGLLATMRSHHHAGKRAGWLLLRWDDDGEWSITPRTH